MQGPVRLWYDSPDIHFITGMYVHNNDYKTDAHLRMVSIFG